MGIVLAGLVAWTTAASAPACPDPSRGDLPSDCPWATIARQLPNTATPDQARRLISSWMPRLLIKLEADRKSSALHGLWTTGTLQDPTATKKMVSPATAEALGRWLGVDQPQIDSDVVHAGLLSTYGALLAHDSEAPRRRRWTAGELERSLGLDGNFFAPLPRKGTLYRNATYFFGRIALSTPRATKTLATLGVADALTRFKYEELEFKRLEERVRVPQISGREIVLRTDVVTLPHPSKIHSHLIVYSTYDPSEDREFLAAGFLASQQEVQKILDDASLGDEVLVSSHYDTYVEGLTGAPEPYLGSRRILEQP